ncbi:hypothetical protein HZA44_04695 [Candidatus Peregrinibacteria bacterium]|nr:hypothetical protein [Candidatus Peregrinibacteria bacterium]
MKKILPIVVLLALLAPVAQAATLFSQNTNSFYKNETKQLWPITVTAEGAGEITAQHGINLLFENPTIQLLWDAVPTVSASGTAVQGGKIASEPTVGYLNEYRIVHIPVLADFAAGESVTLAGLRIRAYRYSFGSQFIRLDTNGDFVSDAQDVNKMEVFDQALTDHTPPYAPTDFTAVLADDLKSVSLRWKNSPDWDLIGAVLDRKRVRGGFTQDINILNNSILTSYVDTDLQVGDVVTYKLYSTDNANFSEALTKTIEVRSFAVEPPPVVNPPVPPTSPAQSDEQEQLTSLFSYYKVRQAIKCRVGVPASDSACLWAKIDVVYAQTLLGRSDVQISLSARDLYLMGLRIVWPEKRYQTECVEAPVPDKSCPALEKSIKRVHYFID